MLLSVALKSFHVNIEDENLATKFFFKKLTQFHKGKSVVML